MNYEALLKKHMQHVIYCEGWSFMQNVNQYSDNVQFTEYEIETLEKIQEES